MAPPTQRKLVLVTGISGYLGSNVAYQLFKAGYAVRGTARRSKLAHLRESVGRHYPLLELVNVDDIFKDDLTEAFKGVYALIHVATALPGADDAAEMIRGGTEGTRRILDQAYKAGVRKAVVTSSFASLINPDFQAAYTDIVVNESNWGQVNMEEANVAGQNPMWAYSATKILAEKTAWQFAAEKPDFDLATVLPVGIYGPMPPHFALPHPESPTTSSFVYALLQGKMPPTLTVNSHDVRDVALAHIRALELPPIERNARATAEETMVKLQDKRVVLSAGQFTWAQAADYLWETRPELRGRLFPVPEEEYDVPDPTKPATGKKLTPVAKVDATRAKKLLKMDRWIDWKESIDATVDWLLRAEKIWKEREAAN